MMGLPQASSYAPQVDHLFDTMLGLSGAVVLGVFVTMTWFCVRYRHGSNADRTPIRRHQGVELTWTLIPFAMFMAIFGWSMKLWLDMRQPPADAKPVYVVAKQWMWKIQHTGGQREIDQLHVPLGQPTRLVMTSQDVIHSFYVPAFRMKQDVLPGRYTQEWFTPTRLGTFDFFCAEYCGTDHSRMRGKVVVMKPADYARWLADHAGTGLAARGKALYRRYGCSGCHEPTSGVHAPSLVGVYGSTVPLADGSQVRATETYLHDSIMLPKKQVVAGYAPIMPSFEGRIGEEDVLALVAWIKSQGHETEAKR